MLFFRRTALFSRCVNWTLLERLDHRSLTNLHHLEARFQHPKWDPALDWCVPYMHSATGILVFEIGFPATAGVGGPVEAIPIHGA